MAFKIRENAIPAGTPPRTPLGEPPEPLVGRGWDTILPPSALATKLGAFGASVWRGPQCPEMFSSGTACVGTPHFTNTLLLVLGAANIKPAPVGKQAVYAARRTVSVTFGSVNQRVDGLVRPCQAMAAYINVVMTIDR